ncbi:hypothetical protein NDU88_006000 [Pleurodeles waltl]|uniref:Myb-like domain-containing protein n=1 Tax=Pleurodeles waltl TaxID=8319 RepID=A0AAV7VNI6_PLEWA|nr:hypothetical protein NDU88_006000 [Pleurodeles waltl]
MALQDKWNGQFEVVEHKSEVTFLVDLRTPKNPLGVLHVNRLKPQFGRTELSMFLVTDVEVEEETEPLHDFLSAGAKDGSVEGVNLSPSLTVEQQRDCCQVLGQLASLFLIPGVTHLCTHDVDTGDSAPIKQKVYRMTDKRKKKQRTLPFHQRRTKMDPRCHYRPQEDDSSPGTSQDDPHKNQDTFKKNKKCCFSAEEKEILVKEVMEHQHQLFVTSKLPISRREAIWQQIVDKINSVAEVRRTVIECKKRWHDCRRRTMEKMARNRKAALQTGAGSPAHQEDLDHMEKMVAAVIPEEIVTGIPGQDSTDYQETMHIQEEDGSPADMPVPDFPDDMDDEPINIPQETIQKVLDTIQTPPSVTRRSTEQATISEDPPTTPIVRPASSNTAEDSDNTGTSFERTVVGVQWELAREVRVGMQTMAASLEVMRLCMMSSVDQAAARQAITSILQGLQETVKEFTTEVRELP